MRNMRNGWPLLINPLEYPFNRTPLFHEHYDWCLSCREKVKYIPVPSPYTRESIFHPLVLSKVRDNDLAGGRRVGSSRVGCSLLFISWSFVIVARRGALYVGTQTILVKQLYQLIPHRQEGVFHKLPACLQTWCGVYWLLFFLLHIPASTTAHASIYELSNSPLNERSLSNAHSPGGIAPRAYSGSSTEDSIQLWLNVFIDSLAIDPKCTHTVIENRFHLLWHAPLQYS